MAKKYSVKIDNKEISVKDGFVLKEELNETLDSGTIQFLSEGGESNIDPFDSVVIKKTGARLPEAYQEVEYIESDGNQFLNVDGIYEGTKVLLDFELVGTNQEKAIIGGGWDTNQFLLRVYNGKYEWYGNGAALTDAVAGVRTKVYLSHSKVKINGVEYNETDTKGYGHLILFGWKNEVDKCVSMKLYECKIFSTETRIEHLIPCYRKSDGRIGMYDIIGHMFFTYQDRNHPFTKGADVDSGESNRTKLLVDTLGAEIEEFGNTLETSDYLYTINLFSETKLLERITLPNLAITKRPDGTIVSVFDKIKEYCKRYLPYIKVYNASGKYDYKASLRYDEALESKFSMECPEFVWNTPTLKEVLMDLFSVADCIPVVKENVLTYFDLTYKGKAIDTTKLTNKTISKTSADYCDSLTLPMKNIISKQPVVVKEHLLPHTTGGEMTSNNAVYITRKPIYKIKKATMYVYDGTDTGGSVNQKRLFRFDITNKIVEKAKYEQLNNGRPNMIADLATNKCAFLYFERGNNTIHGLGDSYKLAIARGGGSFAVYAYMAEEGLALSAYHSQTISQYELQMFSVYSFDHPFIELEYETIEETVVNVSKSQPIKNKQNTLFDSQSANSVDLEHQTLFEYAKANRLSSKIEQIEGVYESESDIPALGDYIGNKILFSKEVSHYDDTYIFKGQLCENYILRNYFTGITSKRRSWSIVDTNEAVLRQDYYKFFVLLDTIALENEINRTALPYYFATSTGHELRENFLDMKYGSYSANSKANVFNTALIKTRDDANTDRPSGAFWSITDLMVYEVGSSIIFSLQQNDNYSYGDKIIKDDSENTSRYLMDPIPYCDNNGEFKFYRVRLAQTINELQPSGKNWDEELGKLLDPATFVKGNLDTVLDNLRNNPVVDGSNASTTVNLDFVAYFHKDNREIVASSLQFEYVSNSDKIIVNDDIGKVFCAGSRKLFIENDKLGIKKATNKQYKVGDVAPIGSDMSLSGGLVITQTSGKNYCMTYTLNATIGENDCWCIYSKITGKILIAVNGTNVFYMGMATSRDYNVYNSQIDKIAVGECRDTQAILDENYGEHEPSIDEIKVLNRYISIDTTKDF